MVATKKPAISKSNALRLVMREIGLHAPTAQILAMTKRKYGVECDHSLLHNVRSRMRDGNMGRFAKIDGVVGNGSAPSEPPVSEPTVSVEEVEAGGALDRMLTGQSVTNREAVFATVVAAKSLMQLCGGVDAAKNLMDLLASNDAKSIHRLGLALI